MPAFFQRSASLIRSLFQRQANCHTKRSSHPDQQDHALAAFEQGDWLAELELLQLANVLQRSAIADVLEADHGWSFEQSVAWLERMGLWKEEV